MRGSEIANARREAGIIQERRRINASIDRREYPSREQELDTRGLMPDRRGYSRTIDSRAPGRPDILGHHSIQAWSAGPLFPAVICRVEVYRPGAYHEIACPALDSLAARLVRVEFELQLDGWALRFSSYEDAAYVAKLVLNGGPDYRALMVAAHAATVRGHAADPYGVL